MKQDIEVGMGTRRSAADTLAEDDRRPGTAADLGARQGGRRLRLSEARIWDWSRAEVRGRPPSCSAWREAFSRWRGILEDFRPADAGDSEIGRGLPEKVVNLTMANELLKDQG